MPLSNVNSTSSASAVSSSAVTQQSVVDVKHPEYIKVKADLEKIGCHLTKLVKLNNAILVDNFETELALLSAKKNQPDFAPNIQSLYHGTTAPLNQICDEGLDERLSRKGRFGYGIYFSDNPEKCRRYAESKQSQHQQQHLLRCRVILGDIKKYDLGVTDSSLTREPLKTVTYGKRVYYDSVQGQPLKDKPQFTEYVIYNKRRAVIDYLVFYSPPNPPPSLKPVTVARTMSSAVASNKASSAELGNSRSSSPVSGDESPVSGRQSPTSGDDVETEEPVQRVNVARNRARVLRGLPPQEASSMTPGPASATFPTSATNAYTTAGASSSSSSVTFNVPSRPAASNLPSPHVLALKSLLAMKDQVSSTRYEELTKLYYKTYGVQGGTSPSNDTVLDNAQADNNPVSAVMSSLIDEFKGITQCKDDQICRTCIEMSQMDLSNAIELYMDNYS